MNFNIRIPNFSISRWKIRHIVVLCIAAIGIFGFLESRAEWSPMHRWNRAVGDMSLVLIAIAMAIGPVSRLVVKFRTAIPWRRELGIYGVLLAFIHTAIILAGWVEWDIARIFGYEWHLSGVYVMALHGFGLANIIGIMALLYDSILALSSSNWSQRLLGISVWKFLQQSAYVLWILIVVHTGYFLYLHFLHFHRPVPDPNWAQLPFAALVTAIVMLQLAAFLKTWKLKRGKISSSRQLSAG
jgi:sulfoxide reductase heme-binding subunit YedZ